MALFIRDQISQVYGLREVKGKDNKERVYANLGFLSSSKVQGTEDYAKDEPLYISALVKGKSAIELLKKTEAKSLISTTVKVYTYSVEKNGVKEQRTAWEILTAIPYIPKAKKEEPEPTFQDVPDDDMPF